MQKDGQEHILVFKKWVGPKMYIKVSSQMILNDNWKSDKAMSI